MRRASKPTVVLLALLLLAGFASSGDPARAASFPGGDGRIAFASNQSGNWDIYSMNPDGSRVTRLTSTPADETQPSFSPDGSRIAFASERGGNWDIYSMQANGGGVTRVTSDPGVDTQPSFSPDGQRIVFIGKHGKSWFGDIFLIGADGSNETQLTSKGGIEDGPTFSPDGSRIAFGRTDGKNRHIFTIDPAGGGLTALTSGDSADRQPAYSPDGQRIAFASRRKEGTQVYSARTDGGGGAGAVTSGPAATMPAYSPSGRSIAFVRGGSIFTTSASGGRETQLTSGRGSQAWPSWQPIVSAAQGGAAGGGAGAGAGAGARHMRFGKPIVNRRRGIAKLPVKVPAAGRLRLRGRGVKPTRVIATAGAATVKLLVKPRRPVRAALKRRGWARVRVRVTYTRAGGARETRAKTVKLRLRRRHR